MNLKIHEINSTKIAELLSEDIVIKEVQDAVDLLGNSDYMGARKVIVHEENLVPEFFNLKTGIAGEILQKFSNYRMQMAIVGDFTKFTSKSLKDFIFESNKAKRIVFVKSVDEALTALQS